MYKVRNSKGDPIMVEDANNQQHTIEGNGEITLNLREDQVNALKGAGLEVEGDDSVRTDPMGQRQASREESGGRAPPPQQEEQVAQEEKQDDQE